MRGVGGEPDFLRAAARAPGIVLCRTAGATTAPWSVHPVWPCPACVW